ncbi:DUF934 domain-containing protein [Rhodoferax sp.]|uniref:DUF934 domain-containing protein n=1 Tax=Rhodoferax sp. TaxID=50421 RepID=UPI0027312A05|nr:DUF934 domain-containing protein [Rhodoferax sp.]MDP1531705.1 DUF934 domain-containing protein [Rhodoferax sp.]MDP1944261.1 DUF934 domain-containing protein [Rhodoferax sp.]MDP2441085.1 DUF934 domain-containing protein [Rhodoferax sp.]MDZ4209411.1 DUF934 domain-containing protein [Rhodoferax sp.]
MNTLELIPSDATTESPAGLQVIELANDANPSTLALEGVARIELNFPKFTDGRAFSQAYLLRRRLGFKGDIRATGDVLVDQLLQMQRTGFSSAVLRADQNLAHAQRQLTHFAGFYQGDAAQPQPQFVLHGATA